MSRRNCFCVKSAESQVENCRNCQSRNTRLNFERSKVTKSKEDYKRKNKRQESGSRQLGQSSKYKNKKPQRSKEFNNKESARTFLNQSTQDRDHFRSVEKTERVFKQEFDAGQSIDTNSPVKIGRYFLFPVFNDQFGNKKIILIDPVYNEILELVETRNQSNKPDGTPNPFKRDFWEETHKVITRAFWTTAWIVFLYFLVTFYDSFK